MIATEPFTRKIKKLARKHKSVKSDLVRIIELLSDNPTLGTPLGKNCYKIRMAITSKGKGKSGGARIVTYVRIVKKTVFLLDIFDKSDRSTISDNELIYLIDLLADD